MILIEVRNEQGAISHSARFLTLELANAWKAQKIAAGIFGEPGKFTVEQSDTSAEDAAAKAILNRRKKRDFGEKLIDKISTINESKGINTAGLDGFMTDPTFALMREHLWAGNIPTFVEKLTALDVSAFFTAGEKAAVIAECESFLTSLD